MSSGETNEKVTEKVLVFNMGGFLLKLIFSIGFLIWTSPEFKPDGFIDVINYILSFLLLFVVLYAIASLFGFAVRVTGNYIIGAIVFVILFAVFFAFFGKVEEALAGLGSLGEMLLNIILIAVLVWPVINDIRKAILYIKSTV